MRCRKVRKLISTQVDGELDDARRAGVDRHVAECEACRAFAADMGRLADELDLVQAPEARWGFADRVSARLPGEQPAATGWRGVLDLLRPAPLGVGAAAFCLGMVVTLLANGANGQASADSTTQDPVIEEVAGDYATLLAEASIEQHLWALFPETED